MNCPICQKKLIVHNFAVSKITFCPSEDYLISGAPNVGLNKHYKKYQSCLNNIILKEEEVIEEVEEFIILPFKIVSNSTSHQISILNKKGEYFPYDEKIVGIKNKPFQLSEQGNLPDYFKTYLLFS